MLRLTGVVNELSNTHRQIEATIAKSEKVIDPERALWIRLQALIGNSEQPVDVPTDEIALLFAAKKPDLASDVLQVVERHRIFQTVVGLYARKRAELGDRIGGPILGDPRELEKIAFNSFGPLAADVESLAHQLRSSLATDSAEAIRLLPLIAAAFREYFQDRSMFPLRIVGQRGERPVE